MHIFGGRFGLDDIAFRDGGRLLIICMVEDEGRYRAEVRSYGRRGLVSIGGAFGGG